MEECWEGVPDPERVRAGIEVFPLSHESDFRNARHACYAALRMAVHINEVCLYVKRRENM